MSLFSFGSSKHAHFHARVTLHELDNVPLLDGNFAVKWKVAGAHALSASALAAEKEKEHKEREKLRRAVAAAAGKDETPGGSGTSTPGSPPKKHRHHHHHHHHHHASQQISQQSQQSSPAPEEAETTPASRSSKRAARLAASDPGGSGPFLMASGANEASEAPAASDTVSAPHSREPSGGYGAIPPGTSASTSISEHEKIEGGLPGAASASSSSEGSERAANDDAPGLRITQVEPPSAQQADKGKGKMLPPPVPRAATTGSALQQAQSQQHQKPSRLSRLLHTLSPLSNSHAGDAASSVAGSSNATALSSPSSVLSPAPAQQRSSRSTSSSAAASGSKKGKLRRLPSPPISALVQEDRRSSGADYSRSASGSGSGSSRQKQTKGDVKERDMESYWDERPGSGSVGDGSNGHGSWGSSGGSKGLHVTQPLTPGLDLTRERPSLSSKHSSSRLSTGSSRSRDKEPSPTANGKHAHTLPHAHLPHHLIPHIPIPGVGSGTSGGGSGTGSRPGSAGGSGAQTPALGGAAAQFEPKGVTDQVAVKDHTVKWDRTFEVGLRIPIEKYKPPQDAQPSNGANGSAMSRDEGASSAGNNAAAGGSDDSLPNGGSAGGGSSSHGGEGGSSGAGAGGDKQGDGNVPRKRSKSSLQNDLSASPLLGVSPANAELERERERQRELAEAWGMLGSATLRLVVKQRIETDESHGTQSDSEAGFVELNLAEYAPWPPSHLQAQVLAPHKPHSSKHRHHRMPKRVETRRYLLRDSKSNSRLKLTIELTFISGTAEYAVPRIQRGVPVDNLSDYVHMSAAMVGGISRRQQQLHTQMQQLQHLEACGGGDCDCDKMSMRSSAGGSSRGVSNRPSSSSLMYDARAGRSSTSLSMQSDPYGDLLIGGCEPILRPSIPAKNFRDGQASAAASRARSSLGASASSFGAPYGERDPTSIIEMIFDQAKFHATTPARSQHNEKAAGHGDKQLPHSLTMPPPSSFPAPVRQMTLPCLLEPKRPQSSSSTGSSKRSSFLFKSRKSNTKVSSGDVESNASSPSVPSKLASVFSRSTSCASASGSGSVATPTESDRLAADMSRSSSNLAAPPLTASPTQLSPVASRGESERSVDAPAAEAKSAARESLIHSVSIDTAGAKASASQLSVPDIDISSPSGRTFASFTSRQQSFAALAPGAGAADPDSSASFDQADSSLSSDSFSFRSGKPPLRRHSSTPAMMTPMADTVAVKKPAVVNGVDGDSRSVKSDVLDLKKEQAAKVRVNKRGIAPEIAHARGYRGVGWQTTPSNGSSDSQPSLVQPQPRMQAQAQHLLDLPYAALSRHGSSESYGSLSSSITPPYPIAQTPPALVTAAE